MNTCLNHMILVIVLVSILSVEMGQGLKCYVGSKGVAKKETECDDDVKNCKTYTTSKAEQKNKKILCPFSHRKRYHQTWVF